MKNSKNEYLYQHACHPSETKTSELRAQMQLTTGSMQCATEIHYKYWLQKFIKKQNKTKQKFRVQHHNRAQITQSYWKYESLKAA